MADLFAGFNAGGAQPRDGALAAPWIVDGEGAVWFSRATHALGAIVSWSKIKGSAVLWVPDYFCNSALVEARRLGAEIIFYPIKPSLEPDWDACAELAKSKRPALFVLVHYFGRAADAAAASAFCGAHGAQLIEDAAHVLRPTASVGRAGDFAFYSAYKMLPVPDGAVLACRDPDVARAIAAAPRPAADSAAQSWLVRKMIQKLLPDPVIESVTPRQTAFEHDLPPSPLPAAGLSAAARRMIAHAAESLEDVASRRRTVAARLQGLNWGDGVRPLFAGTDEGEAPYRFIVDCGTRERAGHVFARLNAAGCPAESWPDLPPEIAAQTARHAVARELRQRLLFLPVHQSLDAERAAAAISDALGGVGPAAGAAVRQ